MRGQCGCNPKSSVQPETEDRREKGKQNTKEKKAKYPEKIQKKERKNESKKERERTLQDNALELDFTTTADTSRSTFDIKPVSMAEITCVWI